MYKEGAEMIITITLNPAVDKTCELTRLTAGEVNRMRHVQSVAGGKGVNVAKVLRRFHLSVAALGFAGGCGGRLIEEALEKLGAQVRFTPIEGETRTSTNILTDDGSVTELLEPGPEITQKELEAFLKNFSGSLEDCELAVFSGSVPRGVPVDIYARLIAMCREAGVPAVLDTSGEPLREAVRAEAKPFLIKPNQAELETLVGRKLESTEAVKEEAQGLAASGIGIVAVSLGTGGLVYADGSQALWQPAKEVKTVNTVGCGDSVVASLCMSLVSGDTPDMALRKAAALAAANAMTRENASFSMEDYLGLL